MDNLTIFDIIYEKYKPKKNIRLIEMFSGYGSQALALKYLGINFEHWKTCEWAIKSIQAYKDIHFTNKTYDSNLTKEEYVDYLFNKGISSNYNEPMTYEQIKRIKEKGLKTIYDNIQITHNLVNIQQVKGKDLDIVDTDKYDYILTYSFPCQDLSLAGKGKGMKDTSTRSGMLWEVERILKECKQIGNLPQILLMENVPQVHSYDNVEDFNKWQLRLEELGYKNYWQDLIATDFGIPQTRNRCFMISILGEYNYTFPQPIPLKLKLKDLLEDKVDEKYYLSDKMIKYICSDNKKWIGNNNESLINKTYASTINTGEGQKRCDASNYICNEVGENYNLKKELCNKKCVEMNNIMPTLTTRGDCLGVVVPEATKKGYAIAKEGDGVYINRPHQKRGVVQKGKIQTLKTNCDVGVVIEEKLIDNPLKDKTPYGWHFEQNVYSGTSCCRTLKASEGSGNKPKVLTGFGKIGSTGQYHQQNRVYDNNVAISVTTAFNPYYKHNLRIRKLTPKECFRLMGVKDEDFENVRKNQSDSSLYHLAGDSIVTNVLMAIFGELFEID